MAAEKRVVMDAPSAALRMWEAEKSAIVSRHDEAQVSQAPELKKDVAVVEEMHRNRETLCQTIPLLRRPFKRRPRPNTALIAYAAQRAYQKRMEREALARFFSAPAPAVDGYAFVPSTAGTTR